MRYLLGAPQTVYSLQNNLYHRDVPGYTSEDVSGTIIGFEGGSIGVLYASNAAIPNKWLYDIRVVARNLTAEFSSVNCATITHTVGPVISTESVTSEANVHLLELLDLHRAIVEDGETRTPIREGALTLELALAASRSAERRSIEVLC
jgi:predicted dehydrogenase